MARRRYILQVSALLEHRDPLPAGTALRLERELAALTRMRAPRLRRDAAPPPGKEAAPVPE